MELTRSTSHRRRRPPAHRQPREGAEGVPDGTEFTGFDRARIHLKSANHTLNQTSQLTNAVGFACDPTLNALDSFFNLELGF